MTPPRRRSRMADCRASALTGSSPLKGSSRISSLGAGTTAAMNCTFWLSPRPQFDFPGAWLYSGSQPVLHLNDIARTPTRQQPADFGVIDHVAFGSRGFEAMKKHLNGKGVPYRVNQVPNSTRWQIFFRDPNNVEIELNFETKNEMAA